MRAAQTERPASDRGTDPAHSGALARAGRDPRRVARHSWRIGRAGGGDLRRIIRGIRTLRLDRVNCIAATLLRNLERDIRRDLQARRRQAALTGPDSRTRIASGRSTMNCPLPFRTAPIRRRRSAARGTPEEVGRRRRGVGRSPCWSRAIAQPRSAKRSGNQADVPASGTSATFDAFGKNSRSRMVACPNSGGPGGFSLSIAKNGGRPATDQGTEAKPVSHPAAPGELPRLPGLFRRWELLEVLQPRRQYHLEDAGTTDDGTPLVAVFECVPDPSEPRRCRGRSARAFPSVGGPFEASDLGRSETVSGTRE